jgi:pantoate--beta-alanine ligase
VQLVTSIAAMQRLAQRWLRQGVRVGLVPTMGYLHEGHLSLIGRARQGVGKRGRVVVSIYVNPTQFGPREDFSRYPRDLKCDLKLCRTEGADVVFAPPDEEMYPGKADGLYSTYVAEERLSRGMEGASRPGHFRGVTTIVAKLFNIVRPELAVFGAKDFQQAAILKRMAHDLNFAVNLVVAPTVRERDGVAMSSRNKYLVGELRPQATVLWRAIQAAREAVRKAGKPVPVGRLKARVGQILKTSPVARLDYVEFFEPDLLVPVARATRGTHMALAAHVGKTRLIDNARI